jgi:hypothetical protein
MDTSEKMFISFFVVLIVGLIVLNLVLFFNNKNTKSVGGKETHTCKDGTTFTCYGGTEGCMDNSPMHCPTPVDVVGNCCNKDGSPDINCNATTKDNCKTDKGCVWQVGPCQCKLEHGTCGTKSCVGGSRFCGLNLPQQKTTASPADCDNKLKAMGGNINNFVSCDSGYTPKIQPVQTNCKFICEKKPSVGGKETHTCKDGTKFTCYAGTEGCMENSPMHCPTPVDVVGTCCNDKDGSPDGKCNATTQDKCNHIAGCKWRLGPCQCQLDNGTCLAKACVGENHLCGINNPIDSTKSKDKFTQEVCERMLGLHPYLISCDPNYIPKATLVDTDNTNGGNCKFTCEQSK